MEEEREVGEEMEKEGGGWKREELKRTDIPQCHTLHAFPHDELYCTDVNILWLHSPYQLPFLLLLPELFNMVACSSC